MQLLGEIWRDVKTEAEDITKRRWQRSVVMDGVNDLFRRDQGKIQTTEKVQSKTRHFKVLHAPDAFLVFVCVRI